MNEFGWLGFLVGLFTGACLGYLLGLHGGFTGGVLAEREGLAAAREIE